MKPTIKIIIGLSIVAASFALGYQIGQLKWFVTTFAGEKVQADKNSNNEDFSDFLNKFIADSSFQLERVKFPVKTIGYFGLSDATSEPDTLFKQRADWKTQRLFGTEEFKAQIYDNFELQLRDTDERVFCWEGIENGIDIRFKFSRVNGRWYLIEYVDLSS